MEFNERIPYFCEWLKQAKIDVAILFDRANVRYFSAFRMNRATSSILIIKPTGAPVLVVPLLDYQRALKKCSLGQILHFPEDVSDYLSVIKEPLAGIKVSRAGVELSTISYSQMRYLRQLFGDEVEFVDVTEI
ncbi:MAG: aminopeptidase P family N-terminal domain-containing protein, partial [Candidatus Aerophobetes bacterium]|nr:aminopeptidase P family N-terminal domain-containing protein [Candidatus Aerophobetes bacterium]